MFKDSKRIRLRGTILLVQGWAICNEESDQYITSLDVKWVLNFITESRCQLDIDYTLHALFIYTQNIRF